MANMPKRHNVRLMTTFIADNANCILKISFKVLNFITSIWKRTYSREYIKIVKPKREELLGIS